MPVPFHRSLDAKGALALSFSAFLVPVLFVLIIDAFLLPSSVHTSQMMAYEDTSVIQAVFEVSQPHLAARDLTPKMGYMLGNRHLEARQEVDDPAANDDEDPAPADEDEDEPTRTTSSRSRTTTASSRRTSSTRRPSPTSTRNDPEPTATTKKPKVKTVNSCAWNRMIKGTNTTPLWLTLGLSAGAIAGILISAFTAYQYGKASKGGGAGGAGGGGMGGPPPMF